MSTEILASDGLQPMEAATSDINVLGSESGSSPAPDGAYDGLSVDVGGGADRALTERDASNAQRDGVAAGGTDGGGDVLGPAWIKIASRSPQHYNPAVAYDPSLQRAALFGGHTNCTENQVTNQTWEWDGAAWSKVTPTGQVPSARGAMSMAFDGARGEAILHGGWTPPDAFHAGTYAYNLGTHVWTSRGDKGPTLTWYAIDYDTDASLVRLFGGADDRNFFREIRTWGGTTQDWKSVKAPGPQGRARHGWVFDQVHRVFVMFGGVPSWGGIPFADTWEYATATTTWQQTATSGTRPLDCDTPPPMAYDPDRRLVVMYCSLNQGETWEYDAGAHAWSKIVGASQVGAITGASMFYDRKLRSVLLAGGCKSGSLQDGTWQYIPAR